MTPSSRSWPRRMLNRLEVDQAVFFAVAMRGWQLLAGPVVLLLMARYFAPDVQGYYYTFASLLGLHAFVELGLKLVILNIASHEWAHLGLDVEGRIVGDAAARARLVSLGRKTTAWFVAAAAVFGAAVGGAGYAFFRANGSAEVDWQGPWAALVAVTAMQIILMPALAILDGCRQMSIVNRYRFAQAVTVTLVLCTAIASGAGLWTAAAGATVRLAWDVWIVCVRYRRFFTVFATRGDGPSIGWREEILPLQWRLAIQCALSWFSYAFFAPVLFHYHGPVEAGRWGLTWAAVTALQAGAVAWVDTRAPLFGMLIARRDYRELDRVFFRVGGVSLVLLALGLAAMCGVVLGLESAAKLSSAAWLSEPVLAFLRQLSQRILPTLPTVLVCAGLLIYTVTQYQSTYLFAHKRNPLLLASVVSNALVGLAVWQGAARWGSLGAAAGYLTAEATFALPCWTWIWLRCRREWHRGLPLRAC